MTLEELETHIDAFDSLLDNPGWKLLITHMQKQADTALTGMRGAKTNDELVRETLKYMMLKDFPQAPEMLKSYFSQQLQQQLKKK